MGFLVCFVLMPEKLPPGRRGLYVRASLSGKVHGCRRRREGREEGPLGEYLLVKSISPFGYEDGRFHSRLDYFVAFQIKRQFQSREHVGDPRELWAWPAWTQGLGENFSSGLLLFIIKGKGATAGGAPGAQAPGWALLFTGLPYSPSRFRRRVGTAEPRGAPGQRRQGAGIAPAAGSRTAAG